MLSTSCEVRPCRIRRDRACRGSPRTASRAARQASVRRRSHVCGRRGSFPLLPGPGLGDMEALEKEGEAGGRKWSPEPAEQVVVAAAAADRMADRGVVDLEDRTGVVAEI